MNNVPDYGRIKKDTYGRLLYDKKIHTARYRPWTTEELAYLCANYGTRGAVKLLSLNLGRTSASIHACVKRLKKEGLFEHYASKGYLDFEVLDQTRIDKKQKEEEE